MAYVIVPDGDDDYMAFSLVSLPNDFIITFVGVYLTAAIRGGLANGSGTWVGNPFDDDSWAADLNQSGNEDMVTYAPVINETLTLILTRVSGTTTMSVNGNLSVGVSNTATLNLDELFRIGSGFLSNFALETLTVNDNGTDIHKWDATASSHTAGTPTLTDTIGGNDAVGVNMETDGSAWVDLGGEVTPSEEGMDNVGFLKGWTGGFKVGFYGDFNTTPEDPNNYRFQNGDTYIFENGDNYEFN